MKIVVKVEKDSRTDKDHPHTFIKSMIETIDIVGKVIYIVKEKGRCYVVIEKETGNK